MTNSVSIINDKFNDSLLMAILMIKFRKFPEMIDHFLLLFIKVVPDPQDV